MAKSKSIPQNSHYSTKPRINVEASVKKFKNLVEKTNYESDVANRKYRLAYEEETGIKTRRQVKQKISTSHLYTGINMLYYFVKCFDKGQTTNGTFNFTHSYFRLTGNETCTNRTVFNRINRLIDLGIIYNKQKSVADFDNGKGAINCVEVCLNKELLLFWDDNINKSLGLSVDKPIDSQIHDHPDESLKKGLETTVNNLANKFKIK